VRSCGWVLMGGATRLGKAEGGLTLTLQVEQEKVLVSWSQVRVPCSWGETQLSSGCRGLWFQAKLSLEMMIAMACLWTGFPGPEDPRVFLSFVPHKCPVALMLLSVYK
jgi:hypothetical protein